MKRDAEQGLEQDGTVDDNGDGSVNDPNTNFPEEYIPQDEPDHEDPDIDDPLQDPHPPASNGNSNGNNSENKDVNSTNMGAIIGIAVSAAVCTIALMLLVRQRVRGRKVRELEQSLRHADPSLYSDDSDMIVPKPNTKTRRYRDFLDQPDVNPDIPNMGSQRSRSSYHDHVFDNVDLI
jgi:hypothetical protein